MFNSYSPSDTSETISSVLSDLLRTGRTEIVPEATKYVCHTSTIPLATTVDEQSLLKRDTVAETVEVTHSIKYQPGFDLAIDYRCCKKHCMFFSKSGKSEPEILRANCPCGEVVTQGYDDSGEEVDFYLQPLCFLQVIKELRYDFGYEDTSVCETDTECCHNDFSVRKTNRPRLFLNEVMFCPNSQSIFDNGYSKPLRVAVGFDGWIAANTSERIGRLLNHVYWFKYVSDACRKYMDQRFAENFKASRECLEQALHTVNGLICKKLLLMPCEMEGYRKLGQLTAQLFEEVICDYLRPKGYKIPDGNTSIFVRMKGIMKSVKRNFCSEVLEHRAQCIDLIENKEFRHCKFSKFFQPAISRLRRRMESMAESGQDFTKSIAWMNIMQGFSQTRNLGYLPPWVAEVKRKEFRDNVGRDKVQVPRDQLKLIRKLIMKQQADAGIEQGFLDVAENEARNDFKEVINSIKLPLKPTASVRSTVFQGGKVEDARQLLQDAMNLRWRVPIRNLKTGVIEDWIQMEPDTGAEFPPHEGYLFWISLQLMLNWFGSKYAKYENYILHFPGEEPWIEELWKMSIVHISEPGKERNLTKTSAVIAWLLTPASKVSQAVLSLNMDHRAGLVLSAQDWMHQRRVASGSYESDWMYDRATRKRFPGVWNGFQDWKESTDFIPRQVGGIALTGWFEYIKFPRFYGELVLLITQRDYKVSEYTHTEWTEGVTERQYYNGVVQEGFMMSMPLTKTVLHLMHDINVGAVHALLKEHGIQFARRPTTEFVDNDRSREGQFSVHASNL